MTTLARDGLELRYEVHGGSGPALLLPQLNFSWPDYLDLGPFTERFTVVSASPRGFGRSDRLDADAHGLGGDKVSPPSLGLELSEDLIEQ